MDLGWSYAELAFEHGLVLFRSAPGILSCLENMPFMLLLHECQILKDMYYGGLRTLLIHSVRNTHLAFMLPWINDLYYT